MVESVEDKIKAEWNTVRGWVATHQVASIAIALVVAWLWGRFIHWPI